MARAVVAVFGVTVEDWLTLTDFEWSVFVRWSVDGAVFVGSGSLVWVLGRVAAVPMTDDDGALCDSYAAVSYLDVCHGVVVEAATVVCCHRFGELNLVCVVAWIPETSSPG